MTQVTRRTRRATEQRKAGRFVELDGLRGIAALAVVVFHYTGLYDRLFQPGTKFPVHFDLGYLGVQLFFLISGFVIFMTTSRYNTSQTFAKARLVRLYPTYWACLAVTAVVSLALPMIAQPMHTVLVNVTMLQSFLRVRDVDGAYWSLSREIVFYAAIAGLLALTRGRISLRTTTVFAIIWSTLGLALCALQFLHPSTILSLLIKASAAEYAAYFSIGMLMFQVRAGLRRANWLIGYLALVAVSTHYLIDGRDPSTAPTILWSTLTIALVVIPVFVAVALRPQTSLLRHPLLLWFGAISYPLYLLHQNIGYVIIHGSIPVLGIWGSRSLAFVIVVALAWFVHETVETRLTKKVASLIGATKRAETQEAR